MDVSVAAMDDISREIDRRKLEKLVENETVDLDDISTAPIVLLCKCGQEQDIDNDICIKCGRDIS